MWALTYSSTWVDTDNLLEDYKQFHLSQWGEKQLLILQYHALFLLLQKL